SLGVVFTNKPSRANAIMFGALHRANLVSSVAQATQLNPLRALLTSRQPLNSGFLTVTPIQDAYFGEVSRTFDLASPDAGTSGDPLSYSSAATFAVCEGFNEQWYGVP